jgi:hypothetical protein
MFIVNAFLVGLPSALFFGGGIWGITYLLMVRTKKIPVRKSRFWAHFSGTVAILAFMPGPVSKAVDDAALARQSTSLLTAAIFLSIVSCFVLRSYELKHKEGFKR